MGRKFINREKKKPSEVSEDDEWAHITGIEEGPSIEIKDAMDVQERNIRLTKDQQPKTTYEIIKEETRNAMDAAGNTGQYIRFVKAHIDNQKKEIDKIKKIKENFDKEIDLLQVQNSENAEIDLESLDKLDIKTVTNYLQRLLDEKGTTKKKLDSLKTDIIEVEEELEIQEDQIENLTQELKVKRENEKTRKEEVSIIKDELSSIMEKYGITNVSKVIDSLNEKKESEE